MIVGDEPPEPLPGQRQALGAGPEQRGAGGAGAEDDREGGVEPGMNHYDRV